MTSSYIMVTRTPIDPKLIDSNYTTWTLNRFFSKVTYITSIEKQSSKRLVVLESENHNPIKNCKTQAHSFWGWKPCIQIAATALIAVWSNNPHYFQHVCIYTIHLYSCHQSLMSKSLYIQSTWPSKSFPNTKKFKKLYQHMGQKGEKTPRRERQRNNRGSVTKHWSVVNRI